MKPEQFIADVDKLLVDSITVQTNQLLGMNKTNFLSLGLFLKLPITITAEQSDLVTRTKTHKQPQESNRNL